MDKKNNDTQRQPNGQFAKGNKEGNRFSATNQPNPENVSKGRQEQLAEAKEVEKTVDILTRVLQKLITDKQGKELTAKEAMMLALLQKALKGDIRAIELIIKLLGEMPADKQEITNTTPQIVVANETDLKALEELKNADINKRIS